MLRVSTGRADPPKLERTWFEIRSHEFDDFAGGQLELQADGVESRAIFPRHLDDAVDLFWLKLKLSGWHDLTLLQCQSDLGFEIRLLFCLRHRSLQNFTSSQTVAHFFRQRNCRSQAMQIFSGKLFFLWGIARYGFSSSYSFMNSRQRRFRSESSLSLFFRAISF